MKRWSILTECGSIAVRIYVQDGSRRFALCESIFALFNHFGGLAFFDFCHALHVLFFCTAIWYADQSRCKGLIGFLIIMTFEFECFCLSSVLLVIGIFGILINKKSSLQSVYQKIKYQRQYKESLLVLIRLSQAFWGLRIFNKSLLKVHRDKNAGLVDVDEAIS